MAPSQGDRCDRYEGDWSKGKKDGDGHLHYSNGDIFSGTWSRDRATGKGSLKCV